MPVLKSVQRNQEKLAAVRKAKVKSGDASGSVISMVIKQTLAVNEKRKKKEGEYAEVIEAYTADDYMAVHAEEQHKMNQVTGYTSTGLPTIDYILGGGLPGGQCIEAFGPEASGKSAFFDICAQSVLSVGGEVMVLEFEQSRSIDRLSRQGLIPAGAGDRYGLAYPEHAEHGWLTVRRICKAVIAKNKKNKVARKDRPPILIGWDSIGNTATKMEVDYEADESFANEAPASLARVMSRELRRISRLLRHANATVVFINHEKEVFGSVGMFKKTTTPGGKQLKYNALLRLKFWCQKYPAGGTKREGLRVAVTTTKAKWVQPYQQSPFLLSFKHGPNVERTAWMLAKEFKVLKADAANAGRFKVLGKRNINRARFVELMKTDAEFNKSVWGQLVEGTKNQVKNEE